MAIEELTQSQDSVFKEWHRRAYLQRLFLPQDFARNVSAVYEESLVCRMTTNEYLFMRDQAKRVTLKTKESKKYSTDKDYRPQGFKSETLTIFTGGAETQCSPCRGNGTFACPPKSKCGKCKGTGREDVDRCTLCDGRGKVAASRGNWYGRERNCSFCRGTGKRYDTCYTCDGSGSVTCRTCRGSGRKECDTCDGSGQVVKGQVVTRKFSPETEYEYQLSGLERNEFKNGLDANHFRTMEGDLVSSEFQPAPDPETVLQRTSVHSYGVLSCQYTYRDSQFHLNQITSSNGARLVASGLPFSKLKIAVAGLVPIAIAAAAISLTMLLM